jgi:hypothetical protein
MKKVSLERLAEIAPNLGIFTLVDIFKEFGIDLKWEVKVHEVEKKRFRSVNAVCKQRKARAGRRCSK